jgi:hypothetical protein
MPLDVLSDIKGQREGRCKLTETVPFGGTPQAVEAGLLFLSSCFFIQHI